MRSGAKASKGMGRYTWSRVNDKPENQLPQPTLAQRLACKIGIHDWVTDHECCVDLCVCCDAIRDNLTRLYYDDECGPTASEECGPSASCGPDWEEDPYYSSTGSVGPK